MMSVLYYITLPVYVHERRVESAAVADAREFFFFLLHLLPFQPFRKYHSFSLAVFEVRRLNIQAKCNC